MLDLNENNLILSRKSTITLHKIFDEYINCYLNNRLSNLHELTFLFVIMEAFPLIKEKNKWEKVGHQICKNIKKCLEDGRFLFSKPGTFNGLGRIVIPVEMYYERTGNLRQFSETLNIFLLNTVCDYIKRIKKSALFNSINYYDVIGGIAGSVFYLLDLNWKNEQRDKVKKILSFLLELGNKAEYKGRRVPPYYVPFESINSKTLKKMYPDGYLDFGIAHGMMGPMLALSKGYAKGYNKNDIKIFIQQMKDIYCEFKVYRGDIPVWPQQLSLQEFDMKKYNINMYSRPGWCYGNLSILKGFYNIAKYFGDDETNIYLREANEILKQPLNNFNYTSPVICHGYSSLITLQGSFYKEIRDIDLLHGLEEEINILDNMCLDKTKKIKIRNDAFLDMYDFLEGIGGVISSLLSLCVEKSFTQKLLMIE